MMIIENIMKRNVITVNESSTIKDAMQLLELHQIRHIPIVNDKKELVGIVSDSDIRDASSFYFSLY